MTYTPTVQYLPNRLSGVVRCYIQANPGIQFVMWTRDKHLLEPYETEGFAVMTNGSLLIERVKESHQGMYTCTPYNVHGTKGASLAMQVIVKDPPKFEITPDPMYQSKLGTSLEIPCTAVAPNGTTSPLITWQRVSTKHIIYMHAWLSHTYSLILYSICDEDVPYFRKYSWHREKIIVCTLNIKTRNLT